MEIVGRDVGRKSDRATACIPSRAHASIFFPTYLSEAGFAPTITTASVGSCLCRATYSGTAVRNFASIESATGLPSMITAPGSVGVLIDTLVSTSSKWTVRHSQPLRAPSLRIRRTGYKLGLRFARVGMAGIDRNRSAETRRRAASCVPRVAQAWLERRETATTSSLAAQWVLRSIACLAGLVAFVAISGARPPPLSSIGPWLKRRLQRLANTSAGVEIDYHVARIELLSGAHIEGLVVRSPVGVRRFAPDLVRVGTLDARWSMRSLLSGRGPIVAGVVVSDVTLTSVVIDEKRQDLFRRHLSIRAAGPRRPPKQCRSPDRRVEVPRDRAARRPNRRQRRHACAGPNRRRGAISSHGTARRLGHPGHELGGADGEALAPGRGARITCKPSRSGPRTRGRRCPGRRRSGKALGHGRW